MPWERQEMNAQKDVFRSGDKKRDFSVANIRHVAETGGLAAR